MRDRRTNCKTGEGTRVWRSDKRQQDHSGVGQGTRKALTYAFSRPWESGPLFLDRDGFWGRGLHYRTGQCEQSVHLSEPDSGVCGGVPPPAWRAGSTRGLWWPYLPSVPQREGQTERFQSGPLGVSGFAMGKEGLHSQLEARRRTVRTAAPRLTVCLFPQVCQPCTLNASVLRPVTGKAKEV